MTEEKPHVYVLCDNGSVLKHDLPLPWAVQDRIDRKQLRLVNADGSDLAEPDPAATGDSDELPTGSIAVVLGWVGEDKDRAATALEAENATEKPRKGLVAALEAMLAPEPPTPPAPSDPNA